MNARTIAAPSGRYAVLGLLCVALAAVVYVQWHPYVKPPTPLPGIPGGPPIVPGDKLVYHVDTLMVKGGTHPVIDTPEPHVAIPADAQADVMGWAIDAPQGRTAAGVAAIIDGTIRVVGTFGDDRPDVARALNNQAYLASAFSLAIPAAALPPGTHTLALYVLSADRAKFYEAAKTVTITAGR